MVSKWWHYLTRIMASRSETGTQHGIVNEFCSIYGATVLVRHSGNSRLQQNVG